MGTINHGGPAFPQHGWTKDPEVLERMQANAGMTLRDYFAARAMAAMVGNTVCMDHIHDATEHVDFPQAMALLAKCAYLHADAMLAERERARAEA